MTQAWDTINPYGSSSGSIYQNLVCDKLYDRLAFIEEAGTDVTPRGAKSWESADDGKLLFSIWMRMPNGMTENRLQPATGCSLHS